MKLKKLEVKDFGGINGSSPIIIDFGESKFVKVSGENGKGKTSLLNALLVALGYLSKDNKDFVNRDSGKIDIDFEFVGNDRKTYRCRVTKSQFKLEYEGENLPEPITKIKELLGIPGVSPMEIKNKPLKEIVKWLAAYTRRGAEDYEKQLQKHKNSIKEAASTRAAANKQFKALQATIGEFVEEIPWKNNEAKYGAKKDIKALSEKLDEAGKRSDRLIQAETRLKELKVRRQQLLAELTDVNAKIQSGEGFVSKMQPVKAEYDAIRIEYNQAAEYSAKYEWWKSIKRQKSEMDEFETIAQRADAAEKAAKEEVKLLQAEIIPDSKNIEIVLEDEYENGKLIKPEGFYINDVNSSQCSKGEWIKAIISILRKNKTKILILDDFESLGSEGRDLVEKLHRDGCFILAAEVVVGKKELTIDYL